MGTSFNYVATGGGIGLLAGGSLGYALEIANADEEPFVLKGMVIGSAVGALHGAAKQMRDTVEQQKPKPIRPRTDL